MKRTLMSCAVASLLVSGSALAAWPEKPIQIIVPWGAGGNTDTVARLVAEGLQKELKVNVNVVNRTGGAGVVGHDAIAKAKADGYTPNCDGRNHHDAPSGDDGVNVSELHANYTAGSESGRRASRSKFAVRKYRPDDRLHQGESR